MLLELKNLKKYYTVKHELSGGKKNIVKAVDDVSFSIRAGENFGLVGESGCGKTTLARIVIQLLSADFGKVIFDDQDISKLPREEFLNVRKNIQIVFQDPYGSLDPRYSVRNIMKESFTLEKLKYQHDQEKEERMLELIEAVNLEDNILNRYPHEFSGGERQRIAIARALVLNPKLLILDEAVSSLDVIIQEQILNLLEKLQKNFELTYFFISHNLKVIKKISKNIAVMYQGKIVELGNKNQIFNNPLHPYTQGLLSAAINYKTIANANSIEIKPSARLVDAGEGHLVLEN